MSGPHVSASSLQDDGRSGCAVLSVERTTSPEIAAASAFVSADGGPSSYSKAFTTRSTSCGNGRSAAAAKISWMKAGSRAAAGGLPIAEMKRWYLAGDSNQTIGQRVSLHQGTVRRVLIEAGVTMRTRPEQVALNDARTGARVPSRDELVAGYIEEGLTSAELAVRFGISETRIQSMLVRHGVERRRGGIRAARAEAERAACRPPQLIEEIVSLYGSGLSRKATAARVGVHRVVVDDVLRRAGVEFRDRRKLPPLNEWVDRYVDGGETTAEIAATYAVSPEAVLRALKLAGIERRRATARMPPLSDADVVAC